MSSLGMIVYKSLLFFMSITKIYRYYFRLLLFLAVSSQDVIFLRLANVYSAGMDDELLEEKRELIPEVISQPWFILALTAVFQAIISFLTWQVCYRIWHYFFHKKKN